MSCTLTSIGPNARIRGNCFSVTQPCLNVSYLYTPSTQNIRSRTALPRLVYSPLKNRRCGPVCLFGGKGNSKGENETFSWDSLKKAMGGLGKEQSMQDLLRKQMQEQEFDGDGGDGNPPGGGGDGSGGQEDEGFIGILDELFQVVMATIGFVFVYIYMIRGAELTRLARDYIKYLIWGTTSVRLRRTRERWQRFLEKIIVVVDTREDWLERTIVATPTWWHKPKKLARLARRYYLRQKDHAL